MAGIFGVLPLNPDSEPGNSAAQAVFEKLRSRLDYLSTRTLITCSRNGPFGMFGALNAQRQLILDWPTSPSSENGTYGIGAGKVYSRGGLQPVADLAGQAHASDEIQRSVRRLEGVFSIAFFSRPEMRAALFVDKRCSYPLYYATYRDMLVFAPELDAVIGAINSTRNLSLHAASQFIVAGHAPAALTLLTDVQRLRAGEGLVVKSGRVEKLTYWRFRPGALGGRESEVELADQLGELVVGAFRRHAQPVDKAALFLSGGADCRGILGAAMEVAGSNLADLHTYTWFGRDVDGTSDKNVARELATRFGIRNRTLQRSVSSYGESARAVSYLTGGQSDIGYLHPHEYRLMQELRSAGAVSGMRGDQVFGRYFRVYSTEHAAILAGLRRLSGLDLAKSYIQPDMYDKLCSASNEVVDAEMASVSNDEPNDAKDALTFYNRMLGYLNVANYYKQVTLDVRNVLLDDKILDFLSHVPAKYRIDKSIYRLAMKRRYPELWSLPFATQSNDENWDKLLATDSPVRRYALKEFGDTESSIWEYVNPSAMSEILESLRSAGKQASVPRRKSLKARAKGQAVKFVPRLYARVRTRNDARYHPANRAILRVLALKQFLDTVVDDRFPQERLDLRRALNDTGIHSDR